MKLWRFECLKLWKNRLVSGLLLGCFLLNILFLCRQAKSYDEANRCFPDTVKELYQELAALPEQEKTVWLKEELRQAEEQMHMGDPEVFESAFAAERKNALEYVLENVQKAAKYEDYLNGIEEQAGRMAVSTLFSQMDLFSRRNAEQIARKYRHLHGLELKAENSQGVLLATESKMTDLFLAALVILLVYFFICMEREDRSMAFVRCTRYGAKALGKTKIAVIFAGSLLGAFLLYISNFVTAGIIYGFGSMERWIQSIEGYTKSPWKLPLGGYLALFLVGKLMASAVLTGIVIWIALRGKHILRTSITLLTVTAAEYALYALLPPHSWLDILKQCNLFSFIRTERFFQSYETINLFEYPISSMLVCVIAGGILTAVLVFQSIISYERVSQGEYTQSARKKWFSGRRKRREGHSLLYYETYKMLWIGKAGVLIALFLVLQFQLYSGERVWFTLDEMYYKNYIRQLEGDVTEEKLNFIEEEGRRIEKLEEELFSLPANAEGLSEAKQRKRRLTLERQLLCRTAYEQVKTQAERIGQDGVFLDEIGYTYLLDQKQQVFQLGMLLLLFILAFHSVFIVEEISGMSAVWNSISKGKKKIWQRKWILLSVCVLFVCIASDLLLLLFRMKAQGLTDLNVPLRYLHGFEGWKYVSISGYLAGACASKVLLSILTCKMIEWLSRKAGSPAVVLLSAGGITGVFYLALNFLV